MPLLAAIAIIGGAERPSQRHLVTGNDRPPDRRRHRAAGQLLDVQADNTVVRASVKRRGRAVAADRKASERDFEVLAGANFQPFPPARSPPRPPSVTAAAARRRRPATLVILLSGRLSATTSVNTRLRQAATVAPPVDPSASTCPSTTSRWQRPQRPARQSCLRSTPRDSAASSSTSPWRALNETPSMTILQILLIFRSPR